MGKIAFSTATYLALRDRLMAAEPGPDEQTLADTIEGHTDLHEIVAAIVRSAIAEKPCPKDCGDGSARCKHDWSAWKIAPRSAVRLPAMLKNDKPAIERRQTLQRIGSDGRYQLVPHKTPLLDPALAIIKTAKPNPTPRDRSVGANVFGMPVT